MEKENVLEIEFLPVWDKWAWKISKNKIKNNTLKDLDINTEIWVDPMLKATVDLFKDDSFLIDTDSLVNDEIKKRLENIVEKINEKYGTPKRWRAEKGGQYFYIDEFGEISSDTEYDLSEDSESYEFGNYFRTIAEAEKYRDRIKEILLNRETEEECNSEN
ncbi:MAG: hypothetical protein HXM47_08140 [Pseudoleptotrichia goodfellowii]|nr:hypothetical protein [Pseudoleptotrichia goodfellowii]